MNYRVNKFRSAALLVAFAAAPLHAQSHSAIAGTSAPLAVISLTGGDVLFSAAVTLMLCGIPIILISIQLCFRHQREKMLHETIRSMIEKGVPIPPELFTKAEGGADAHSHLPRSETDLGMRLGRPHDLRNGILLLGIGFGTAIVGYTIGWIIVFLGLAFVVASMFEKKDKNDGQPPKV
ncbi:MAG: DUF6249 domain-containing protein [Limisphaerales bacterium]